jgi:exodeoxyribonuclease-3
MRVLSWNVNGLRAVMGKGFLSWLDAQTALGAQIVGLQETRAENDQVAHVHDALAERGWHLVVTAAARKGYSGTALLSRRRPDVVQTSFGRPEFDVEGRLQLARFGRLTVVNGYFPNGNGKDRDNSRIPYKLDFYRFVFDLLDEERKRGGRILVMGDLNTAHREIDLARPKDNVGTSGFTPIEREELDRWLRAGWIDTLRVFDSSPGRYSWWSSRFGVREKNVGWRIDLVLASSAAMPFVTNAFIQSDVMGSDHAPVGVMVSDDIMSGGDDVVVKNNK